MPQIVDDANLEQLKMNFRGDLIRPGDPEYDGARALFNAMFDKRPALIARAAGTADVQAALGFANERNLPLAVRGGGHSVAGFSSVDDGVVIDLSRMRGVRVDPDRKTARAQGGATWGDYDRETQVFGLASPGGVVSTTGVGGLTLGGGFGFLSFKHGMACDNLISADVVLADGRVVVAGEGENPDLLWGLRGGGGNFGIVTSFEFKLYEVSEIFLAVFMYPAEQAAEILSLFRSFAHEAPEDLAALAAFMTVPLEPPMPIFPPELLGKKVVGVFGAWPGSVEEGEKAVAPLRAFGSPAFELAMPMPYTMLQSFQDDDMPWGSYSYWRSAVVPELSDDLIGILAERAPVAPSPHSQVALARFGGGITKAGLDDGAFPIRDEGWLVQMDSNWIDAEDTPVNLEFSKAISGAVQPFAEERVYVNFIQDEGAERVKGAYGDERYRKLVALKDAYDPQNVFNLNQNVKPST